MWGWRGDELESAACRTSSRLSARKVAQTVCRTSWKDKTAPATTMFQKKFCQCFLLRSVMQRCKVVLKKLSIKKLKKQHPRIKAACPGLRRKIHFRRTQRIWSHNLRFKSTLRECSIEQKQAKSCIDILLQGNKSHYYYYYYRNSRLFFFNWGKQANPDSKTILETIQTNQKTFTLFVSPIM